MTSVAIMQPTYLPWLGYFALMDRVDIFVLLDSVQFERRSWQQRNRIKGANGPQMLTVPVHKKGLRTQSICDVRVDQSTGFPQKHVRAIELNYMRAPYFGAYSTKLFEVLERSYSLLADLTIALIEWLSECLGIATCRQRNSVLGAQGTKADLLADICRRLNADEYVSPPGARIYLDGSDAFQRAEIPVIYNDYQHPRYAQLHGPFASHLSVLDLLFNVGPGSLDVVRQGVR